MITNRHITKIVAGLMAVSVIACLCMTAFAAQIAAAYGGTGISMEYESELFNTNEVLEVNIIMEEADWEAMLDNAMSEEYVQCDVEIGGETFYRVGIRPKGNTSLSSIANDPTTNRYSLKLEFDQYVDGQTCYGLDKLILNNSYADTTYMKEALIYDMFAYLGADASLYNYAKVSVNGEYWGLYLALEAVEDSFLLRNYGVQNGELYKPDSMNMGGGGGGRGGMPDMGNIDFGNMQPPENDGDGNGEAAFPFDRNFGGAIPSEEGDANNGTADAGQEPVPGGSPGGGEMPDMGDFDPSEMFGDGGSFGGGMFGNGGANLNYSDDELDSYSTIWDGEVTGTGDADHKRVVTALKNISEGTDLEQYMDIDNLVKYMAVHIFSENDDSLSGSMAHNYYLYESSGRLNLLPWDYNLAFGGFGGMGRGRGGGRDSDSATNTVNGAINDSWSSTDFFDTLLANAEYHAAYYAAMEQVVDYIQNGAFAEFYDRTRALIDGLVETDPNAFYTYEEYLTGVEALYEVVTLRGQSIQGQLDGSIPATSDEQQSSDALIDASHLDLSALGSMNMGGGNRSRSDMGTANRRDMAAESQPQSSPTAADGEPFKVAVLSMSSQPPSTGGGTDGGFTRPQPSVGQGGAQVDGETTEGFDPSQAGNDRPGTSDAPDLTEQTQPAENSLAGSDSQNELEQAASPSGEAGGSSGQVSPAPFTPGEDGQESAPQMGQETNGQSQGRPSMGGMHNMDFGGGATGSSVSDTLILYGVCAGVMLAACLFAVFYRRRPRIR